MNIWSGSQWLKNLESLRDQKAYDALRREGEKLISQHAGEPGEMDHPEWLSLHVLQELVSSTASTNLRAARVFHGIDDQLMANLLGQYWAKPSSSLDESLEEIECIAILEYGAFLLDAMWKVEIPMSLQVRMIEALPDSVWSTPVEKLSLRNLEDHPARLLNMATVDQEPGLALNRIERSDVMAILLNKAAHHLPMEWLLTHGNSLWRRSVLSRELAL